MSENQEEQRSVEMDIFEIEYAKMRQKELDRDIQAINAVRMARKKNLYLWNGKALAKAGRMLVNLGRWLKQSGRRADRNFDTTSSDWHQFENI